MRIRFTTPARNDLEAIFRYIADQNPTAAQRVRSKIRQTAEGLGDFPLMARRTDWPNVRLQIVNPYPYGIFYAVRQNEIHILRVRHLARRPPASSDI